MKKLINYFKSLLGWQKGLAVALIIATAFLSYYIPIIGVMIGTTIAVLFAMSVSNNKKKKELVVAKKKAILNVLNSSSSINKFSIQLIIDGFGIFITFLGLAIAGFWGMAITAVFWIGIRFGTGFRVIEKQEFWVIERMGKFHRVAHDGWHIFLFLGLIDKVKLVDTLAFQSFKVYTGDKGAEIDFTDSSAPVTAVVWFAVGNPRKKTTDSWREIDTEIVAWTYAYKDRLKRVQETVDGFVRPILQAMSLDEAQKEKTSSEGSIADQLKKDKRVRAAMKGLGIHFDPNKPFILSDVDIPDDLKDARKIRLISDVLADADENRGRGLRNAIKAIVAESGDNLTWEQATKTFMDRTSLEALEKMEGANFQFVSPDIGGAIKTLGLGDNK